MRDRNKNKRSSPTDFIRYNDGKMNGKEKNAFERELQKDHFAEEAEEGFSGLSADIASKDMTELKRRLKIRTGKGPTYLFYRIAAAVAAIMVISSLYIVSRHERQPVTLSQNIARETKAPVPVPVTPQEKAETPVTKQSGGQKKISSQVTVKVEEQREEAENRNEKIREFAVAEMKDSGPPLPDLPVESDNVAARRAAVAGKAEEPVRAAGAAIKATSVPAKDYQSAQPVKGRDTFNLYIEKNIRNPEPDNNTQQFVTLSFLVYGDSTISEIKIINSPGEDYSKEAKRLINEGPVWQPATENGRIIEDSVRVNIIFR